MRSTGFAVKRSRLYMGLYSRLFLCSRNLSKRKADFYGIHRKDENVQLSGPRAAAAEPELPGVDRLLRLPGHSQRSQRQPARRGLRHLLRVPPDRLGHGRKDRSRRAGGLLLPHRRTRRRRHRPADAFEGHARGRQAGKVRPPIRHGRPAQRSRGPLEHPGGRRLRPDRPARGPHRRHPGSPRAGR